MSGLIERQKAIDAIADYLSKTTYTSAISFLNTGALILAKVPSAQRTGRWIWDDEGFHCSECWHHTYGNTGEVLSGVYKFCPNCGCAMEGEDE